MPVVRGCRLKASVSKRETGFGVGHAPAAVTLVEVSKLHGPDFMIEIEAIAAA
jgi:enamine deaminase RidA (YjgF/YER057c/UK114 family)